MKAMDSVKRHFNTAMINKLSKPAAIVFIMGVAFGAFLPGSGSVYAKRKSCTDCHKDIKKRVKQEKAHKPAAKSCETCHKRHGFSQKLILVKEAPDLCLDCHKNVGKELEKDNVHAALSEGGCTICHDPHASKEKSLLRKSKGNPTICVTCHGDHKDNLQRSDAHEPYKKKDCSLCHAPHSSSQENLLLAEEKELCASCHKDSASKHDIPSITEVSCSKCHDPHLASKKNPLIANAHAPFSEGSCGACHDIENGRITHRKDIASSAVCADCHGDTADILNGPDGHLQEDENASACLTCHEPHQSDHDHLQTADDDELCRTCHDELPERLKFKGSMHGPFAEGKCADCHAPHGGGGPNHLAEKPQELCLKCHEDKFAPAAERDIRHAALDMIECSECHKGHASKYEPLLKFPEKEMCMSCHDKEEHNNTHPPYLTTACTACHKNHSKNEALLAADVNTVCGQCHGNQLKLTRAPVPHPPAAEGECTSCHQPHGSKEEKLLDSSEKDLCANCHDLEDLVVKTEPAAARVSLHEPAAYGRCSSCHNSHGSANESLLIRPGEKLCYGCHKKAKIDFAEGNIHQPVKQNNCGACHTPHGSSNPALTKEPEPGICLQCHEIAKDDPGKGHKGFDISKGRCTSCHNPHTSQSENLMNSFVHQPFADGSCETCHREPAESEAAGGRVSLGLPETAQDLCLSCHDEKTSETGHQHKTGIDCLTCHTPHAANNSSLLADPRTLCLKCHQKTIEPGPGIAKAAKKHKPVEEGGCMQCHKMHNPQGKKFLVKNQEALCTMCHESIEARKSDLSLHTPFKQGKCSSCHTTHSSSERHLLKKEEKKLCKTCHSFSSKSMTASHNAIAMSGTGCTSCHDPHSMKEAGSKLIPPSRHEPMAEGDCSSCHDAMKTGPPDNALCLECHDQGDSTFADVHPGGRSGSESKEARSCLACHSPHAGYDSLMKRHDQKSTCLQCHDREQFTRKNIHAALEQGCSVCHDSHKMNISDLKSEKLIEVCSDCHEGAENHAHPLGPDFKDPRNGDPLTCISCHEPHSSDFEFLLIFDYRRNLCVQCHAGGTMKAH